MALLGQPHDRIPFAFDHRAHRPDAVVEPAGINELRHVSQQAAEAGIFSPNGNDLKFRKHGSNIARSPEYFYCRRPKRATATPTSGTTNNPIAANGTQDQRRWTKVPSSVKGSPVVMSRLNR